MRPVCFGVFEKEGKLFTMNFTPGKSVYGETLIEENDVEYREWTPWRSKLAAAIKNGLKSLPVFDSSKVLYLGSAEGTTASHVSDIIGERGFLFGVDIAEKVMRKFVDLCDMRTNMLPILADASKPEDYAKELEGIEIDVLYQDLSQKRQAEIFNKNARLFLKPEKFGLIAIKAKSISQIKSPEKIFEQEKRELEKEFNILQKVNLGPFEKDHCMFLCEKE